MLENEMLMGGKESINEFNDEDGLDNDLNG